MLMNLLKRFLPFFLTFVLGLFIASFFVSVALPKVNYERRGWKRHSEYSCPSRYERNNLRYQLDSVRRENERLRDEIRLNRELELDAVPLPPVPPPPPRVVR
ncbi:MAG TPA: hypothetical protein VF571_16760 [Pyrinomonadaceae bacterium]|jgi:hypothetical protein